MKSCIIISGVVDVNAEIFKLESLCAEWEIGGYEIEIIVLSGDPDPKCYKSRSGRIIKIFAAEVFSRNYFCTESALPLLKELIREQQYDLILFGGMFAGELATRIGFRFGGSWEVNVESIRIKNDIVETSNKIYSQNLICQRTMEKRPYFIGIAKNASIAKDGPEIREQAKNIVVVKPMNISFPNWISEASIEEEKEGHHLLEAKHVVVAGRGIRNKSNMQIMYELADAIDGKLGGTRAVVADGMLPSDVGVGSSGKILHPDFCLTFGISGAMPLMAGIEKSKILVSVNIDPNAAIFLGSDFGIVDDWRPISMELLRLIKEAKTQKMVNRKEV
jgi:electron transfer flavoprotein alpha subunit